jgi:hypothetical protein
MNKCCHSWNIIKEHTLPSAVKSMYDMGQVPKGRVGTEMFAETYILILECAHCGALDKTIQKTAP